MKQRIGKITVYSVMALALVFLFLWLVIPSIAVPIHSTATDKLGAFSGDVATDQDDNVKASLDLAHTDLDAIIAYDEAYLSLLESSGQVVYYVDSGAGGTATGLSWTNASVTIDAAIVLAQAATLADTGSYIFVRAGHAETLSAADDVDMDTTGMKIIGLGVGENRPTVTLSANGEWVIAADDCEIHNINFVGGDATVHAIDVEANCENFWINNCRFWNTTPDTHEFIDAIDIAAGADNGRITNCIFEGSAAAAVSCITNVGADYTEISGCTMSGDYSTACIVDVTTKSIWLNIHDNTLIQSDTAGGLNAVAAISLKADTSALIYDNTIVTGTTEALSIVSTIGLLSNNRINITAGSVLEPGKTYVREVIAGVAASTDDLFLVAGGPIEIISFFGLITTVIGGAPGDINIEIDATTATQDADFSTAVTLTDALLGDTITFATVTAGESVLVANANVNASLSPLSWFCPIGTIESATTSTGTGAITWYMTFRPLTAGVTVTPAP